MQVSCPSCQQSQVLPHQEVMSVHLHCLFLGLWQRLQVGELRYQAGDWWHSCRDSVESETWPCLYWMWCDDCQKTTGDVWNIMVPKMCPSNALAGILWSKGIHLSPSWRNNSWHRNQPKSIKIANIWEPYGRLSCVSCVIFLQSLAFYTLLTNCVSLLFVITHCLFCRSS